MRRSNHHIQGIIVIALALAFSIVHLGAKIVDLVFRKPILGWFFWLLYQIPIFNKIYKRCMLGLRKLIVTEIALLITDALFLVVQDMSQILVDVHALERN